MTNSKLPNLDSEQSIWVNQVLLKSFTFLINTADKEIYNIFNSFLFPYYSNTNRTNKHTYKHTNINRVLIIKIQCLQRHWRCHKGQFCIFSTDRYTFLMKLLSSHNRDTMCRIPISQRDAYQTITRNIRISMCRGRMFAPECKFNTYQQSIEKSRSLNLGQIRSSHLCHIIGTQCVGQRNFHLKANSNAIIWVHTKFDFSNSYGLARKVIIRILDDVIGTRRFIYVFLARHFTSGNLPELALFCTSPQDSAPITYFEPQTRHLGSSEALNWHLQVPVQEPDKPLIIKLLSLDFTLQGNRYLDKYWNSLEYIDSNREQKTTNRVVYLIADVHQGNKQYEYNLNNVSNMLNYQLFLIPIAEQINITQIARASEARSFISQ